jgi:hypothetical protein
MYSGISEGVNSSSGLIGQTKSSSTTSSNLGSIYS